MLCSLSTFIATIGPVLPSKLVFPANCGVQNQSHLRRAIEWKDCSKLIRFPQRAGNFRFRIQGRHALIGPCSRTCKTPTISGFCPLSPVFNRTLVAHMSILFQPTAAFRAYRRGLHQIRPVGVLLYPLTTPILIPAEQVLPKDAPKAVQICLLTVNFRSWLENSASNRPFVRSRLENFRSGVEIGPQFAGILAAVERKIPPQFDRKHSAVEWKVSRSEVEIKCSQVA